MSDSTKYASKLRGKKVLIFGGSSGIGFAAAEACVENGMTVVISSSNPKKIEDAIQRILKEYPSAKDRVSGHAADIGDQATLDKNILGLFEKVGKVDHIISTAGSPLAGLLSSLEDMTTEKAIQALTVRTFAPLIIGKYAKSYMTGGAASSITLTSGAIVNKPRPNWVLPTMVMHGLQGVLQNLALELAPIRANIIEPGAVETELWDFMSREEFAATKKQIEKDNATERLALPEDIAEAYLYAMKDLSVTGAIIKTNSGAFLK